MEHFTRITFWIVILLHCFQARSLPIEDSQISFMRIYVKCPSDSTFYTPKNVEEQCVTTALDCIMRELDGTVREECADPEEDINPAVDFFQEVIKERTSKGQVMTNSSECACESWSQAPFSQFLNKVEALLQAEHAAASR